MHDVHTASGINLGIIKNWLKEIAKNDVKYKKILAGKKGHICVIAGLSFVNGKEYLVDELKILGPLV